MEEMNEYEKRIVLKEEFRYIDFSLKSTVLSEDEAAKLDLSEFEDIPEKYFKRLSARLSNVKGIRPKNGVRKKMKNGQIQYIGILLDTRYMTAEFLQKTLDLAHKVSQSLKDKARWFMLDPSDAAFKTFLKESVEELESSEKELMRNLMDINQEEYQEV